MKKIAIALLMLIFLTTLARAQETRSTITGTVTDPAGAIVPNATVQVTNTDTGATTEVKSNAVGVYNAPFLNQGTYQIKVTVNGFKTFLHTGLLLQSERTVLENIKLEVGQVDQSITVTASAPLIDSATASLGQELTSEEVEELPSNGRSPLGFAHMEFGVVAKGKHSESQTRPMDNSTADDFSLGGGNSASNELLLNGVPNMEDSSRTAGFSPQLDAVNAVHVDVFSANASLGDTSGGVVNITTKSGTNQYHGTASEYYSGSRPFTASPQNQPAGVTPSSTHFNQMGATFGGPVRIPRLYNGKDKLFFFYSYELYKGSKPATTIASVPTAKERSGDFSEILNYNASNQLYNPYSGVANSKGIVSRSTIPGNVFSNSGLTVNPVAKAYLAMIPQPNYSGSTTYADGENNFFASDPTIDNYNSNQVRLDYNVSTANKLYLDYHRSHYDNTSADVFNTPLTGAYSVTNLIGAQVDDVHVFSSNISLENRLGFSRYESWGGPKSLGTNPTSMGFAGYMASDSNAYAIPYLTFNEGTGAAQIPSFSGKISSSEYFDNLQYFASLNVVLGHHTIKIGPDIRSNKNSTYSLGNSSGTFGFTAGTGTFVTSGSTGAKQAFGSSLALFELGPAHRRQL